MIVWGGYDATFPSFVTLNDGGRYSPSNDTWSAMTTTGAPTARYYHTAIWTGYDMIVWGGRAGTSYLNTMGRYIPSLNIWDARPAVSLNAPLNNASFAPGTNVTLQAGATDSDGTVARVEFFRGPTVIGTNLGPGPTYSIVWSNASIGTHSLTAVAYDNLGAATTSAVAQVTVGAPPTVAFTSSASNAPVFRAPATIPLVTATSDPYGSVVQVDFFQNALPIGSVVTNGTFQYPWQNVPAGTYSLTAVATDNFGLKATSAPVVITVGAPPAVAITNPPAGVLLQAPSFPLNASTSDGDGTVVQIEYFDGATSLALATTPPFDAVWNNAAAGPHTLTAIAMDNSGLATTSAPVSVVINASPFVSVTNPPAGSTVVAGGTLTVGAEASDPGGFIASVQLFADGLPLPPGGGGPFTALWSNVPLGLHDLTAVATDNLGLSRTSAVVSVEAVLLPRLDITRQPSNRFKLYLTGGQTNRMYRLDVSQDLATWVPWSTNLATNGSFGLLFTNVSTQLWRYYRAVP